MTYLICNKPADLAEHWEQYRQLRTNQEADKSIIDWVIKSMPGLEVVFCDNNYPGQNRNLNNKTIAIPTFMIEMLIELTDNDQEEIKRWLAAPLDEWRGMSPLDFLKKGNVEGVVNLVSSIYYGDSAGY